MTFYLSQAIAYNRSFFEDELGAAVPFFSHCEFRKNCDVCAFDDKLQMYVQRIEVTDACKSEYDSYGALLPNNGDNGKYTDVEPCVDEIVCPGGRGQFIEGTEIEGGQESDTESAGHERSGAIFLTVFLWGSLFCIQVVLMRFV